MKITNQNWGSAHCIVLQDQTSIKVGKRRRCLELCTFFYGFDSNNFFFFVCLSLNVFQGNLKEIVLCPSLTYFYKTRLVLRLGKEDGVWRHKEREPRLKSQSCKIIWSADIWKHMSPIHAYFLSILTILVRTQMLMIEKNAGNVESECKTFH